MVVFDYDGHKNDDTSCLVDNSVIPLTYIRIG